MPRSPGGLRDPDQPLECYLASDASAVVEHTKSYAPCCDVVLAHGLLLCTGQFCSPSSQHAIKSSITFHCARELQQEGAVRLCTACVCSLC